MRRGLKVAIAAVILALAGAAGIVLRSSGDAPAGERLPAADPAAPPPTGAGPAVPAAATPAPPPAPGAQPAQAGPPGPPPWESVLAVHRPSELGRELAAPVADGLDEASNRMDHCYEEERARMAHAKPPPPGQEITGPAVLVLRLEGAEGRLVVAGTEIETVGHSSRAFAVCCEKAMQGYELTAAAAKPGMRIRYKMMLQ